MTEIILYILVARDRFNSAFFHKLPSSIFWRFNFYRVYTSDMEQNGV